METPNFPVFEVGNKTIKFSRSAHPAVGLSQRKMNEKFVTEGGAALMWHRLYILFYRYIL